LATDTHWLLNGNDFEPGLDLLKVNYLKDTPPEQDYDFLEKG
jgi:hypothetical protein